MNPELNARTFLLAFGLAVVLLVPYEWHWRQVEKYPPTYDNNDELWTRARARVEKLSDQDVVIVGSSRGHFDINLDLFEELTGRRPVQLAIPGGSPFFVLQDLVDRSAFKGLIITSVAPGLFFSPPSGGAAQWVKGDRVDFYYKQTPASKFSQWVYMFIDPHFAYLDPDASLKEWPVRLPFPDRDSVNHEPVWPPMVTYGRDRGARMIEAMEQDTVIQNRQKKIWTSVERKPPVADTLRSVVEKYAAMVHKYRERGGRLAFIRPPVTGYYRTMEAERFPPALCWDELIRQSGVPGHTFEMDSVMMAMEPPEWSHLNRKDADEYTRRIVDWLRREQLL